MSNAFVKDLLFPSQMVAGKTFVFLTHRSKKFFRFCTGECMSRTQGSSSILRFWHTLRKARSDASQAAFEASQDQPVDDDRTQRKRKWRRARADDKLVAGEIVKVPLSHHGQQTEIFALFGVKNSHLWVEADAATMEFIQNAFAHDYAHELWAVTAPRGPHFPRGESDDDEDDGADDDSEL